MKNSLFFVIFFLFNNILIIPSLNNIYLKPLCEVLSEHSEIEYIKCASASSFCYKRHPVSPLDNNTQPSEGLFAETFILKVPNGKVCSDFGWLKIENSIVSDFIAQQYPLRNQIRDFKKKGITESCLKKISGKVAVITRKRHECYGHWMSDLLGRLALLEQNKIEYDYLYVPMHKRYMKETFELWGISSEKILQPFNENQYIEADELIVPSLAFRRIPCQSDPVLDIAGMTHYWPKWIINCIRDKFLLKALGLVRDHNFSKKVFISRQDADRRTMVNENEIFELFEQKGFEKYCLSSLSLQEQIVLFNNAEWIAGANGSAFTNLMFCQPKTKVIEIFQDRPDTAFWNLSQEMDCIYFHIKTTEFSGEKSMKSTYVDPKTIISFFDRHTDLISVAPSH